MFKESDEGIVDRVYRKFRNLSLDNIRLLDHFDEKMLKEHVKIENISDRSSILKEVQKFKENKVEFKAWLQSIGMDFDCDTFTYHGILTLESFHHKVKSAEDLTKIIGGVDAQFIWNSVPRLAE